MIFGITDKNNPRENYKIGQGYKHDPIYEFARQYADTTQNILNEASQDLFRKPDDALNNERCLETLKNFFVNESCDENALTESEREEHVQEQEQLFENDTKAMLEYTTVADKNPVLGMSYAVHKNILISCPFDKGAIQKAVAASPKFTVDMEFRYLVTPDGEYIDMWKDQNKMTAAIDATVPEVEVEMTLPERETTDVLLAIGASDKDNLSIETRIVEVLTEVVDVDKTTDPTNPVYKDEWIKVKNCIFVPGYGDYDRILTRKIVLGENSKGKEDLLQGTMMKNKFNITSVKGHIKAVKMLARRDASNGLVDTCSVSWKITTDPVEIDSAKPFNVTISPEEVKDIAALYNINQLTKVMSLIKLSMENYKDDKIKWHIDQSWETLEEDCKARLTFDMLPRQGYYDTHIAWRNETFMDALETMVTDMLQVYNDPNMIVTVFGRPDLIRKVAPVEWSYQSPANIGPCPLEFQRTVVTNADRVYQFISTRKMNSKYMAGLANGKEVDENEFIVILNPRNTDRIMYRIYDYQMYVSNEIRNAANPTLPAVHAFERWKFYEYQPVQGRIKILNPTGLAA